MIHRSTHPSACPKRLKPGDVVEASFTGNGRRSRYYQFTVIEANDVDDIAQTVTASGEGIGAVRFTWRGDSHHRIGHGHGARFYFVSYNNQEPENV